MNNLKKRCLTLLLSLAMIVTYMPTSLIAYAEAEGETDQVQVEQQVDAEEPAAEVASEEAAQEEAKPKMLSPKRQHPRKKPRMQHHLRKNRLRKQASLQTMAKVMKKPRRRNQAQKLKTRIHLYLIRIWIQLL